MAREVRPWDAQDFGASSPVGIAYDVNRREFVVASAAPTGTVVNRVNKLWERVGGASLPDVSNPSTLVFDPATDSLRSIDDGSLIEIPGGELSGRTTGDDIPLRGEPFNEPSAATYDPESGSMLVVDAGTVRIVGPDGTVEESIELSDLADHDLIASNPSDGLLYVLRVGEDRLDAVGRDGGLEASYDISSVEVASPQAMTFAPSTDSTDDPEAHNLFVADSGDDAGPGAVMEVTLEQPPVLANQSVEDATLIQSIRTHQWSPPSTDPSGITWNSNTGRLIVVDSEVNETDLWRGVNMWHITRTGSVTATGFTDNGMGVYSDEPTGAGYDARTNTLFVSDDTGIRSVYVVKPGGDNRFGTADDQVNQINMGAAPMSATDAEDPEVDPTTGHLFVLGGADREVYRLAPVNGDFSNGFSFVGSIDISHLGPTDFEGLTVSTRGTLFVGARNTGEIFEITTSGSLLRTIRVDISSNRFISGLALAPSTINPSVMSLWIVDRGVDEVNDGMIFEITSGSSDPVVNQPPSVDAGPDQTIVLPDSARLAGNVTDDGLPTNGQLVVTWSKASGPGNVAFASPHSPTTTAGFSDPGTYVLRLTASDGQLSSSDTLTLTVQAPSEPTPTGPSPRGEFDADHFVDDDGHLFEGDINAIASAGITRGCNPPVNDRFCPDDTVIRGQMAAFIVRALGYTDAGGGDLFVDDDHSVFEGDIDRLATAGVTRGCNPPVNDRFCPDEELTRGQMAAFLVRALGYTDDGGGDLFVDDDHSVFEGDIDRLATAGVTRGCNPPANDRFCPDEELTRGQMAAFLARALVYGG